MKSQVSRAEWYLCVATGQFLPVKVYNFFIGQVGCFTNFIVSTTIFSD